MISNGGVEQLDQECWARFEERLHNEQAKYWTKRTPELQKDDRRERKGEYFLALSIISLLGGFAGIIYGLVGKDWVQKPYIIMGVVMVIFGFSIVIAGFGKIKE